MNRNEIKQVLVDCIYTLDSKPVFLNDNWVGGDVDDKLKRIDEAVDKICSIQEDDVNVEHASHYLCDADDISISDQIALIQAQADIDGSELIDNVEGVIVWEKLEWSLSCDSFLEMI